MVLPASSYLRWTTVQREHSSFLQHAIDLLTRTFLTRRPNYVLKIHLEPNEIVDPPIHRTLSCPSTATFADLHHALQIAFGWADTHTYDFKIKDQNIEAAWEAKEAQGNSLLNYILRAKEADMRQWDRLSNATLLENSDADSSLNKQCLLRIVEDTLPGTHLTPCGQRKVDFVHDDMRVHPKTPQKMGSNVRLFQVFSTAKYQGKPMEYEYDFGDSWFHEITLIGREDATDTFQCIDGEGHGCAEDVGSIKGWADLKVRLFAAILASCMLSREYSTLETCLIAQRLPENGIADCELTNRPRSEHHDRTKSRRRLCSGTCILQAMVMRMALEVGKTEPGQKTPSTRSWRQ